MSVAARRRPRRPRRPLCAGTVEPLEGRVLLAAVTGPDAVNEGAAYTVTLTPGPGEAIDQWLIDWGDGQSSTIPGGQTTASHVYADGPNLATLSAQVVLTDGSTVPADALAGLVGREDPGFVTTPGVSGSAGRLLRMDDGRLLVTGTVGGKLVLLRLLPDGSLDPTFSGDGRADTGVPLDQAFHGIALAPDGKVVVAGRYAYNDAANRKDIGLVRLLDNGSFDPDFGSGGVATFDTGEGSFDPDVFVLPDRRILVSQRNFVVVRFTEAGAPDPTFGNGGIVRASFPDAAPHYSWFWTEMLVQDDGKVIAGSKLTLDYPASGPYEERFALVRYRADGVVDASFGVGGYTVTDVPGRSDTIRDLEFDADGNIVALGLATKGTTLNVENVVVARYLPGGNLDASFATGGISVLDLTADDYPEALALAPDGRMFIAGSTKPSGSDVATVLRLTPQAQLDPTFGTAGRVTMSGPTARDVVVVPEGGDAIVLGRFQLRPRRLDADPDLVSVHNVAPVVAADIPATVTAGQPLEITFSATDPGADAITGFEVSWGDRTFSTYGGSATGASKTYALVGRYSVSVRATDDDGASGFAPARSVDVVGSLQVVAAAFDRVGGHSVVLDFNGQPSAGISASTLGVVNLDTGQVVPSSQITYFAEQGLPRRRWRFSPLLPDGRYRATLAAGAADPIGNSLTEPYVLEFTVLAGDATEDGGIDAADYYRIDSGRALGRTGYLNGDFDYSGGAPDVDDYAVIDAAFLRQVASSLAAEGVAPAAPPAPAPAAPWSFADDGADEDSPLDDPTGDVLA